LQTAPRHQPPAQSTVKCMSFHATDLGLCAIFFFFYHLAPSFGVTFFEFMEKLHGSWN